MMRLCLVIIFTALLFFPGSRATAASDWESVVFIYHRFDEARYPSTNISIDDFSAHLAILKAEQIQVLRLIDLAEAMASGKPLPARSVVLTVDDAFTSFLTGAWPLLREAGFPVTLFVNTGSVGRPGYLDWDQLRSLEAAGVDIANHTVSHAHLINRLEGESPADWRQRVVGEVTEAGEALEQHLERPVNLFAYPYGEYEPELLKIMQEAGFLAAMAQQSGVVTAAADRFALPRFPMGGVYAGPEGFREKLTMRRLPLEVLSPASPLVSGESIPELVVEVGDGVIRSDQLRCYVLGQPAGEITPLKGVPGRYRVKGTSPIRSRRGKYTLTAPGLHGGWYWFSQPWFNPALPE